MAAIILLVGSILLSCWIPTAAQGQVLIYNLTCAWDGMNITVNFNYFDSAFLPSWHDHGAGVFVDGALPECSSTAQEIFIVVNAVPFYGETFYLNFASCNITKTKNYDDNQELFNYTALVNARFNRLVNYFDSPTADFNYPNLTVPLYCVWDAGKIVNASVGINPTALPPSYGNQTDTSELVMNITTANSMVFEGERIGVNILLIHDGMHDYVAELPVECTISNADISIDDERIYVVNNSCPFWNNTQFSSSLNFDAFKMNSLAFFFEFDAFIYAGQASTTLLIECAVQMCLNAVDCPSTCWPESKGTAFRATESRHSSTLPSNQVSCVVHVLPRTLTSTSPPQTPYPQLSSTQSTSAIYKTNLTALYIVLGVVLVTAFVLCIVLSICFTRPRRSHSDKKQIFRDPYRLT